MFRAIKVPAITRISPLSATFVLLIALFFCGAVSYPNFASIAVVRNLLVDNAFLGVAAVGATFVIISGGIDLSVSSVMALTSILVATLIELRHIHPLLAFSIALGLGGAFGYVQGKLITAFDLPPFMVTLAGMFFARGAAFAVHPQSLGISHPFVAETLNESLSARFPIGPSGTTIPITVIVMGVLVAVAWAALRHLRFGRSVYAIGDDPAAAMLMGLPVERVRVRVYALSGGISALSGIVFTLYQQSGDPASCKGLELDVIAAVVIGGTLLRGGVGSVVGSIAGVMILGIIQTLMSFQGNLSSWWTRIAAAGLVLVFLLLHRVLGKPVPRGVGQPVSRPPAKRNGAHIGAA